MTISFPISPPATPAPKSVRFTARSIVGFQQSPFTGEQTTYAHQGSWLEMEVSMPPMLRAAAEDWIAFLLSLNGKEGTFLMGDPVATIPRGSWLAGSPFVAVNGAHAAGVRTVALSGLLSGATGKSGDWMQFGSGSTSQLVKLLQDFTAPASGNVSAEVWPSTKLALANGDAVTVNSAKGLWRLSENDRGWSVEEAQVFGVTFSAMQAF